MQSVDLNNSQQQAASKIEAAGSYRETSKSWKETRKKLTNSLSNSVQKTSSQLNKISQQQKRFQRNVPNSADQIVNLLGLTRGKGSETSKFIRRLIVAAAVKSEPEVKNIISEAAIKAIGCSQEEQYVGVPQQRLQNLGLDLLPNSDAIFIPLQSLDVIALASGMLKQELSSPLGQILYEQSAATPQNLTSFKPYGGKEPFPMNAQLNYLTQVPNRSYRSELGEFYQGTSAQVLMDLQYQTTNEFGVTGNFYKVALLQRSGNTVSNVSSTAVTQNNVTEFLQDYYSTIKLFDTHNLAGQILNFITNFMSMAQPMGANQITEQSKFFIIAQRILGLCFDDRKEIDVSGNAKVAELDGIDDSFFEFTEVDLRNIDTNLTNVQQGVVEFQDCDNVKLPINFQNITNQIVDLRNSSGLTIEEQTEAVNQIIDSVTENPDWQIYLNTNLNLKNAIDNLTFKNIAIAVAASTLTPKVLLPIFTMLSVVEKKAINSYNQQVTSANTFVTTATTLNSQVNNIVTDGVGFLKVFKKFSIDVISKIGAIFIRNLFELLKKDILNLISSIILDIKNEELRKKYQRTLRLVQIGVQFAKVIVKGLDDYRKCKSILDDINNLITLINGQLKKRSKINLALAVLSDFLPGESPDRAFINTTEYLQSLGIPTGPLPSGTANLMNFFSLANHKGRSDEQAQNGVNDAYCLNGLCWSVPR